MLEDTTIHNAIADKALSSYIILSLIHSLETTNDILKADVIRKTLEIVLRYTADDM